VSGRKEICNLYVILISYLFIVFWFLYQQRISIVVFLLYCHFIKLKHWISHSFYKFIILVCCICRSNSNKVSISCDEMLDEYEKKEGKCISPAHALTKTYKNCANYFLSFSIQFSKLLKISLFIFSLYNNNSNSNLLVLVLFQSKFNIQHLNLIVKQVKLKEKIKIFLYIRNQFEWFDRLWVISQKNYCE